MARVSGWRLPRHVSVVLVVVCALEASFWMTSALDDSAGSGLDSHLRQHVANTTKAGMETQPAQPSLPTAVPAKLEPAEHCKMPPAKPPPARQASASQHRRLMQIPHDQPSETQPPGSEGADTKQTGPKQLALAAVAFGLAMAALAAWRPSARAGLSDAAGWSVWIGILSLPLVLSGDLWRRVFPAEWCATPGPDAWPSALGLSLGLLGVAVGQVWVLLYHWVRCRQGMLGSAERVQPKKEPRRYEFSEGVVTHLAQPEGFVLLGGYLTVTWMLRVMPDSYYNFEGGVQWHLVLAQLLLTDALQYGMHLVEHQFAKLYKESHKPHHRFTNPRLFDAFNGSPTDTCLMILIPLALTAQMVHCNLWSYIAFGSLYANWLTLIHSEVHHPWDRMFQLLGMGTPADHHVHHKLFVHNYGHLFMYWDHLGRTYKDPACLM